MGMRLDDWCRLDVDDFNSAAKAWNDMRDGEERGRWERMRILGSIVIQPHIKGKMTAERLLPLPWDKEKRMRGRKADQPRAELLSKDAQKERLLEVMKRKRVAIQQQHTRDET